MALSIITISCLISLLNAEILVPRMQIRGERSGWKPVKLRAEAPATAVTKHFCGKLAALDESQIFELPQHEIVRFC